VKNRTMSFVPVSALLSALSILGMSSEVGARQLLETFDPFPTELPAAYSFMASSGRAVHYSTFGDPGGKPVLWFNGLGFANWATVGMYAYLGEGIDALGLRFIYPERTGYGNTPHYSSLTPDEYVDDVAELMSHLGYEHFSVLAISAGGTSGDHIAVRHPHRIDSLHFVAAVTPHLPICPVISTPYDRLGTHQFLIDNPSLFMSFLGPRDFQTASSLPGFEDWLNLVIPYSTDPVNHTTVGFTHDVYSACLFSIDASLFSSVTAPVFVYSGGVDPLVSMALSEERVSSYPDVTHRVYPNEGHYVVLRHAGQVLVDIAGLGHKTLLCHQDRTLLVGENAAQAHLAHGDILDVCAWKGTPGE
jgi:non-heme chloroperoxidase